MSIDEQIEAAWKEQEEKFSQASPRRMFEMGYLAALRSLYVEVKPEDMECGIEYAAAIKVDGKIEWKSGILVSLSDNGRVCQLDGWGWLYYPRSDVVMAMTPNPLPSPSDIFGRGK